MLKKLGKADKKCVSSVIKKKTQITSSLNVEYNCKEKCKL